MRKPDIDRKIPLMKPFMPPLDEFTSYLQRIWKDRWLTNGGNFHNEFEEHLCDYLGVRYISLFANGTLALFTALKVLGLKGQVITTPFTHVATANAIVWNGLTPVFADINETDFNLSVKGIEQAVNSSTAAILPLHLFGQACDVEEISQLAKANKFKVLYDATHCFGVEINGTSILDWGELSVLSFHATKVFNTFEGGAIICHDREMKTYIDTMKNNGLDPNDMLTGIGLNAKMNEIQAAFGLLQLKYADEVIGLRKAAALKYREMLEGLKGVRLPGKNSKVKHNYCYFPVIINPEEYGATRDQLFNHLINRNIFPKKYFSHLITDYKEYSNYKTGELPVARMTAERILCLPLFHDISFEEQWYVAELLYKFRP